MKITKNPYNLLSIAALIFIIPSLLVGKQSVDIHFHDAYYVLWLRDLFRLFAFVSLALWMVYKLAENVLYSRTLTWAHVIFTLLTILVLATMCLLIGDAFNLRPAQYVAPVTPETMVSAMRMTRVLSYTMLLFAISQLILAAHIIMGFLRKKKAVQ